MFSQGFLLIEVHMYIHLLTPCRVFHYATCKIGGKHLELVESFNCFIENGRADQEKPTWMCLVNPQVGIMCCLSGWWRGYKREKRDWRHFVRSEHAGVVLRKKKRGTKVSVIVQDNLIHLVCSKQKSSCCLNSNLFFFLLTMVLLLLLWGICLVWILISREACIFVLFFTRQETKLFW